MKENLSTLPDGHDDLLIDLVVEIIGTDANKETFTNVMVWLMDDISGFEGMAVKRVQQLINHFWSKYCGKKPH